MEYVYVEFQCALLAHGELGAGDRIRAREEIARGLALLQAGRYEPTDIQWNVGRLYHLVEDYEAAIPHLAEAKQGLKGVDRVTCDRMLIEAFLASDMEEEAREIISRGIRYGGRYAHAYEEFADLVAAPD